MAFNVHGMVGFAEFRRYQETKNQKGEPRMYATFEDFDGKNFQVTVADPELIGECRAKLVKAHCYDLDVQFRAGDDYSYITLLSAPMERE